MKSPERIKAGVGERMQYLAHRYNDTTIRFILHYPGSLDPDILCAATKAVVGAVDVLHSSFMANSVTCRWRVNSEYSPSDYFSVEECDGDPMKAAGSLALQPVRHEDLCQLHVTLIRGSDTSAVVVRISHLVADGSDGKYLLGKLAEGYRLIGEGRDVAQLSVKNGSRSAANAYRSLGLRKIMTLMRSPFNGVKTIYPFLDPTQQGEKRMLRGTIPAQLLSQARLKAKAAGASVNDLVLTACYRAFAKVSGREGAMSINGFVDLRKHCKGGVSEGLSNMSGGLATTLEYIPGSSFEETLREIVRQTREAKRDPMSGLVGVPMLHIATKTAPMHLLLKAADIVYSSLSLSLTNLGNIPCEPLAMGGMKPCEGVFGGPLKRKPSVQVGAASFDGTAELTILGEFTQQDAKSLDQFLKGMEQEIAEYLENTAE